MSVQITRRNLLVAVLIGLGLGSLVAAVRYPTAEAGIVVDEPVRQVGVVKQGSTHDVEFTLTNETTRPANIISVHASCDCTGTQIETMKIDAGKSAKLKATWNTTNKKYNNTSRITVIYNVNGAEQKIDLSIIGYVTPSFKKIPSSITFQSNERSSQTIRFIDLEDPQKFKITGVSSPNKSLNVSIGEDSKSISVDFDPLKWLNQVSSCEIEISLDNPGEPFVFYPIEIMNLMDGQARSDSKPIGKAP